MLFKSTNRIRCRRFVDDTNVFSMRLLYGETRLIRSCVIFCQDSLSLNKYKNLWKTQECVSLCTCACLPVCLFVQGPDDRVRLTLLCVHDLPKHLHINAGEAVDTTDLMSTLEHVKIKQGGSTVRLFFVSFSSS